MVNGFLRYQRDRIKVVIHNELKRENLTQHQKKIYRKIRLILDSDGYIYTGSELLDPEMYHTFITIVDKANDLPIGG